MEGGLLYESGDDVIGVLSRGQNIFFQGKS